VLHCLVDHELLESVSFVDHSKTLSEKGDGPLECFKWVRRLKRQRGLTHLTMHLGIQLLRRRPPGARKLRAETAP